MTRSCASRPISVLRGIHGRTAQWDGDLPVHGHRGQHHALGTPARGHAGCPGAPRCAGPGGHRRARGPRRQDLYPSLDPIATEARIAVNDPLVGTRRAQIVARPVLIDRLEALLVESGAAGHTLSRWSSPVPEGGATQVVPTGATNRCPNRGHQRTVGNKMTRRRHENRRCRASSASAPPGAAMTLAADAPSAGTPPVSPAARYDAVLLVGDARHGPSVIVSLAPDQVGARPG
jgi:hypothetical protein